MTGARVQPFRATLADGTTREVCCGPALLRLDVAAYASAGESRPGACCHTGAILRAEVLRAEREAYEWIEVHRALDPWR